MLDWNSFQLMVFDVDGTLYDQKALRRRMTGALLGDAVSKGRLDTIRILRSYRKWREELADAECEHFEDVLVKRLATRYGRPGAEIEALVAEWMERRPLPYLKACRRERVAELFASLRSAGKIIGILSDYPAEAKLASLELEADVVVSARDPAVDVMKPNPRGIEEVMRRAGVTPAQTIMVGDRAERDGEMGARAGVRTFVLTEKPVAGPWTSFRSFDDLLGAAPLAAEA